MDARLTETGNGGDLTIGTNDMVVVTGIENMPYLSMFGGSAYWANDLLLTGTAQPFVAETETALIEVPLNSQGRVTIENAMKRDVQFLITEFPGTTLDIQTKITDDNKLEASIKLNGEQVNSLWNPLVPQKKNPFILPPYPIIWVSPIGTGVSTRYAITAFEMTFGIFTASFPAAKMASASEQLSVIASYNVLAAGFGMSGIFQLQGVNVVYVQHASEEWEVTTAPLVLQTATEVRLKVITPSGATQNWSYDIGGIGSYSITDWGDGSAITTTHPPTIAFVTVNHVYADGMTSKAVVIYTNDTLVKTLRFTNNTTVYSALRIVTRPPISTETIVTSNQQLANPVNLPITACVNLKTLSLVLNNIISFSPPLFSGNFPLLQAVAMSNNKLSSAQVDTIFNNLVYNSPDCLTHVGSVNTLNQTPPAPPTAASATARGLLISAGWTLFTD